jgi:hypothetical protein
VFSRQLYTPSFFSEMEGRRYTDWKLRDLTVQYGYSAPRRQAVRVFTQAIPNLHTMGQAALYQTRF